MNILIGLLLIIIYLVIGRIFAHIYTNTEGFIPGWYEEDMFELTIFWPVALLWWGIKKLGEFIDDKLL